MIATRKRPMHFPIKRYLKMFVAVAVLYELCSVPFTHKLIFDGPLKPLWKQVGDANAKFIKPILGPVAAPITKPLHFAFQQRQLMERSHEMTVLKATLAADAKQKKADTKQIADLQQKLSAPKPADGTTAGAGASSGLSATPAAAVTPSADDIKTASYWGAMEAENAASIAQKLAPEETARIFLAMKPDAVAEIMNTLPTEYNVKLKAVHLGGTPPTP
jgi:flagellar motility protein MotE (MotC chaperone)